MKHTFILWHSKFPLTLSFDFATSGKGLWCGIEAHACRDCAQFAVMLFLVQFRISLVKKGPGFNEYMKQINELKERI